MDTCLMCLMGAQWAPEWVLDLHPSRWVPKDAKMLNAEYHIYIYVYIYIYCICKYYIYISICIYICYVFVPWTSNS